MKVIPSPDFRNPTCGRQPGATCKIFTLQTTVIDARRFPILARHWPGRSTPGGQLAVVRHKADESEAK